MDFRLDTIDIEYHPYVCRKHPAEETMNKQTSAKKSVNTERNEQSQSIQEPRFYLFQHVSTLRSPFFAPGSIQVAQIHDFDPKKWNRDCDLRSTPFTVKRPLLLRSKDTLGIAFLHSFFVGMKIACARPGSDTGKDSSCRVGILKDDYQSMVCWALKMIKIRLFSYQMRQQSPQGFASN